MIVESIEPMGVAVSTSPPAKVHTAQAGTSAAEFVGAGEHLLGGLSEPVQGCDDEGVTVD